MSAGTDILIGIDGTHSSKFKKSPEDYDKDFAKSHVRHIVSNSRFSSGNSSYIRGPAGLGAGVNRCFMEALDVIERLAGSEQSGPVRLHLTGFSRGAAIALDLGNEFAQPPQGLLSDVGRILTPGKTIEVVTRIAGLRRKLAGRLSVPVLALFDPVDMSTDIDGVAISRHVGAVAIIRRSPLWGSRIGWTNVGDMAESGEKGRRSRMILDGTHGAMGGLPHGDLPKILASQLLASLNRDGDWDKVERRYRSAPLEVTVVKAMLKAPGLFVHPRNGGFLGAAAYAAVKILNYTADGLEKAAMVQTYRPMLKKYVSENGALLGAVSMLLDSKLGSFRGIDAYFHDFPLCSKIISSHKAQDERAALFSRLWMAKTLGPAYPAKA